MFNDLVYHMPGNGLPVITNNSKDNNYKYHSNHHYGLIKEYPNPLPFSNATTRVIDLGHRHFSGLHWLYPGTFHPFPESYLSTSSDITNRNRYQLYGSALETLEAKTADGSGHTAWSAVWQSCLWSRLRTAEESWISIVRLLDKYTTSNLLSLHPNLHKEVCETCHRHNYNTALKGISSKALLERGLVTADRAKVLWIREV
jgi:hypothetical protein